MTNTHSYQAIFFREGPGYLFVKHLNHGVDANVTLVRSSKTGALFVRKEPQPFSMLGRKVGGDLVVTEFTDKSTHTRPITAPPCEAEFARKLKHISNVNKLVGWALHADEGSLLSPRPRPMQATSACYFEYCNIGSLKSANATMSLSPIIASKLKSKGRGLWPLPEYWICKFTIDMLDALIKTQHAGVCHADIHVGNWLLHQTGNDVSVLLADFGRAENRADQKVETQTGIKRDCADLAYLLRVVAKFLGTTDPQAFGKELKDVFPEERFRLCSKHFWAHLHHLYKCVVKYKLPADDSDVRKILDQLRKHLQTLKAVPWPKKEPEDDFPRSVTPEEYDEDFKTGAKIRGWCIATFDANANPGSDPIRYKDPPQKYIDEWMGFRPRIHHQGGFED